MVNCLRTEKEAFWLENKCLPEEQIQRRWVGRTAELKRQLSSVLDPTPPAQQHNPILEDVSVPELQNILSNPQPTANMTRGLSVSLRECCCTRLRLTWRLDRLFILWPGPKQ